MKGLHGKHVTHAEAREIAQRFVDGHFGNRRDGQLVRPYIEIPANPDRDDDLRLSQYIDQCEAAEHSGASRAGQEGWVAVSDELPDSDVWVLVVNHEGDHVLALLEFTDDSEGHGEPYWDTEGGDLALCNYPRWRHIQLPRPSRRMRSERWVRAAVTQPQVGERVICWSSAGDHLILDYAGAGDFVSTEDSTEAYCVTHWVPLLPPPPVKP